MADLERIDDTKAGKQTALRALVFDRTCSHRGADDMLKELRHRRARRRPPSLPRYE